jgi:hypothetical protein
MSREEHDRIGTADLVAGAEQREMRPDGRNEHLRKEQMHDQQQMREPMRDPQARDPQQLHGERPMPPQQPQQPQTSAQHMQTQAAEPLAALFPPQVAQEFRQRWDQVQIGFVDDPRRAVQQADELVAHVMKSLATTFADQRSRLEAGLGREGDPNTEDLRVALRGYRSFFQRLLSL